MIRVYGTGGIYSPQHAGIVATFPPGHYIDGQFQCGSIESNDPHVLDLALLNGLKVEGEIDAAKTEKPVKAPKVKDLE